MNAVVRSANGAERALADQFAQAASRLPGNAGVATMRARAFEAFAREGLPHRRLEQWKYTDLRNVMQTALPVAPAPDAAALDRAAKAVKSHSFEGVRKLVMVDGFFAPSLSDLSNLEGGLTIRSLASVLKDDAGVHDLLASDDAGAGAMFALNSALMTDGVVIEIAENALPARPLHIVHVMSGRSATAAYTRSMVRVGAKTNATLVESFIDLGENIAHQINDALIIAMADDVRLDHVRLMEDNRAAINVSTLKAVVGANTHFNTFNMTTGGALSRYQMFIRCAGSGGRVDTNGVNLLNGQQHGDTTLFMDHAVQGCPSRENFRAVIDDRARSVFQGRILVRREAQQTDAKMMTRALLLSDEAEADNKPELEIFADDVSCGHGATAGALDESLLFYLRARGLPEKEAQALLIQAFVGEAIEAIVDDRLRDAAIAAAVRWLEARDA